jgi:hypothetical protein
MAEVWFAWEGPESTSGGDPAYTRSRSDLEKLVGLKPAHFICPLDEKLTFPETTPNLGQAGYQRVVVTAPMKLKARVGPLGSTSCHSIQVRS